MRLHVFDLSVRKKHEKQPLGWELSKVCRTYESLLLSWKIRRVEFLKNTSLF